MKLSSLNYKDAPKIVTTPPGPKSQEVLQRQKSFEGSAVSYPKGIPVAFKDAKGATLRDVDGNIYIDFFGGAGVLGAGHLNPSILSAIRKQEEHLIHTLDLATNVREELSEKLIRSAPGTLMRNAKVIFGGPTGSDAVEAAVKLAKYNSNATTMLSFEGGYHGMTGNALAVTANTFFKKHYMPMGQSVQFLPYAYCYRCPFDLEHPNCDLACAKYIDHVLSDPGSGVCDVAGLIIEPIQGEGGSIVPPDGFLREIRKITEEHSIPLIADEIQAGLGRTGNLFSCEGTGITPDIITMSKALGGGIGFPLSGIMYKKELDIWHPGAHIGTFRGFLPAMAGGIAYLDFLKEKNILQHVTALGDHILKRLKEIEEKCKIIGEVRGRGLMLGIEIVQDKHTKQPAKDMAEEIRLEAAKKGIIIEVGGHYHNVVRLLPPLVLTKELADKGVNVLENALKTIEHKHT